MQIQHKKLFKVFWLLEITGKSSFVTSILSWHNSLACHSVIRSTSSRTKSSVGVFAQEVPWRKRMGIRQSHQATGVEHQRYDRFVFGKSKSTFASSFTNQLAKKKDLESKDNYLSNRSFWKRWQNPKMNMSVL